MNGKKARAVRKFAQHVTEEGTPDREYKIEKNSRSRTVRTATGEVLSVTPPGTIYLDPDCRRAVYKRMKAAIA